MIRIAEYGYVEQVGPIPENKTAKDNASPTKNSLCAKFFGNLDSVVSTKGNQKNAQN